jgi:hypothetical protein
MVTMYQDGGHVSRWWPCIKMLAMYQDGDHVSRWWPCIKMLAMYQDEGHASRWWPCIKMVAMRKLSLPLSLIKIPSEPQALNTWSHTMKIFAY